MAFPDIQAYNAIVYSLADQHPQISHSTLVLAPIGSTLAKLEGQIIWHGEVVLDVWELVDFQARRILKYSYEVHSKAKRLFGMILLSIRGSLRLRAASRITNTFRQTLTTIGCPPLASVLRNLT